MPTRKLPMTGRDPFRDGSPSGGVLERLIEALHEGAVLADAHGLICQVNQACLSMFGYSAGQLIGQPVAIFDCMQLPLGSDPDLSAAIARQGIWEGYSAGLHHDGTTFPMTMTIITLSGDGKQSSGYVVIFRNATESLQALEDLRSALYLARSARQARRQIVNSITHEFRTPIAAIIGFSDLLENLSQMPPVGHEFIDAIRSSAERLKVLVDSVIEYASIQAERTVIHAEPYQVRDRLRSFVKPVEHRVRTKNLRWKLHIDPSVPAEIFVDGEKVERILELLLDNATKFTSKGSVGLSVVRTPNVENTLSFRVQDTGIGYDSRKTEQLFETFRQGEEGLNRRYPGIGMGLALARQLCDLLGGTLQAAGVEGKGSTFTFTLPIGPTEAQQKPDAHTAP